MAEAWGSATGTAAVGPGRATGGEHAAPAPDRPQPALPRTPPHTPEHLAGPRRGLSPALLATGLLLLLVALRVLRIRVHAGEGGLAADGYLLSTGAGAPAGPLTPEGAGALHIAGYAALTGAFGRDDALVTVGRETLAVATLIGAVLLWWAGRRLGLTAGASTAAALLFGIPVLGAVGGGAEAPALLATAWLAGAGCLVVATRRAPRTARIAAALVAVPAIVLAPETALLVLSAAAVLVLGRWPAGWRRWAPSAVWAAAFVAVAVLVRVLDASRPPLSLALALAGSAAVLLGALAVWWLPALRPVGAAVTATAIAGLVPPVRPAALVLCLPAAAVLAAALAESALASTSHRPRRPIAVLVGAGALAATAVVTVAVPLPGPPPGNRPQRALLAWAQTQLPTGTRLLADRLPAAELRHAGAPPREVALPGRAGPTDLRVAEGGKTAGGPIVARFSGDGGILTVSDPAAQAPTAAERARRRQLADALLANPTTQVSAPVRAALQAGAVDARLLTLMAALAAQSGVGVSALPDTPDEPAGAAARKALIASVGGMPLRPGSADTDDVLLWLRVQRPPYRPDTIVVTQRGLLIAYRYASAPDALVTRASR